jgi:hypothetical protein
VTRGHDALKSIGEQNQRFDKLSPIDHAPILAFGGRLSCKPILHPSTARFAPARGEVRGRVAPW